MRAFTYLGDRESVTLWGIHFPCGVAVSVSDPHALRKLAGNGHFREVFDEPAAAVAVVVAPPAPESEPEPEQQAEQNADAHVEVAEVAQPKRRGRPPKAK